ncbi:MAG: hypothetical protein Ct9H300mP20_07890 [Gammaproteobacteria bacterium]|nr:MAG: hypothetical protein Ct9H300mP20_07890 [Gammaproteobacteria bacterium]
MLNFELIKKAEINSEFYPFFTIQDVFLNKEDHKKIATDFPNINKGGSFHLNSLLWREIQAFKFNFLEGDQMRTILKINFK